ncbi:MAG TPA: LemA family protein [bacterium]|nr:LemA family protein [bacterium]
MTSFQSFLAVLTLVVLWVIFTYNRLITLKTRTQEAWSDIDVQLKRRYNLIPNLVEAVKGYAGHERQLFENVTKARTQAMGAQTMKEHSEGENFLSSTLKSLFAVTENYPDLKASQNFLELQRELRDAEDKIQSARRFYNGNVRDLNIKIDRFPEKIIASMLHFKKMEFFELKEEIVKEVPKVNF